MKNIGFAKIGKSVKFKRTRFSPIGGDNEPSTVLISLANNNPDKTFYIIGRSDFSTLNESEVLELFPYDNVVDIWKGVKNEDDDRFYRHIIDYFNQKGFQLDNTIMMVGQVGTVTIPGKITQVKHLKEGITDGKPASVIDMTKNYTSPIAIWLNEVQPPYVEIVNDPRYVMNQSRDIFHLPTLSLGQYDYEYEVSSIRNYEDQNRYERKVSSTYAGMETCFCVNYEHSEQFNLNRKVPFMVILNEAKPSRYNLLKEWVLDDHDDVEIYGKWDHSNTETDTRFKGSIHLDDVMAKMNNVKFTFIIPIAKGWVTSKYIEMVHAGVIPFLHPTYDEQKHLPIPNFLRPKTPTEFKERMTRLLNNEDEYESVITGLRKLICKPEYYDGTFLNNKIMTAIDEDYVAPDISQYEKKTAATLEDFFG
tara:strand:- start:3005 stop:4264 length:1260 start_codon:yes stop_codon:yes gene_type:complete